MILVTVGTTLPFDALIEAVDRLVEAGEIDDRVVCQIGRGAYRPRYCEYFSFKPHLDHLIREASLIIGHGGTGTIFSALNAYKPLVAVVNPDMADDHQAEFLARLSGVTPITWTRDLNELSDLIKTPFVGYHVAKEKCLVDDLKAFLAVV